MTVISKTLSITGQILTGTAPDDVIARRLKKCKGCSYNIYDSQINANTCGTYLVQIPNVQCGCVINDKVVVLGESCPQHKW